jgi:hypothetical protein
LLEKFIHNQRSEFKIYLDHFFYTVPKMPVNWREYIFPSTNIGQEGVYQVYKYLYSKDNTFQKFVKEDSIYLSQDNH